MQETGDEASILGSGRSAGEGSGNQLLIFLLEKSHGQRSVASYSPKGHKESDTTEQLSKYAHSSLIWVFPWWLSGKDSACQAGDLGSFPGCGRSSGEGNGNLLQYSCLENSMDRGTWWATVHGVAKNQTQLSN